MAVCMELNLPATATCPLCESETVKLKENKNGRPMFTCTTFKDSVNMRGDEQKRTAFLNEYTDSDDSAELDEPEADDGEESDEDDAGPTTMADIINNAGGDGDE